MSEISKKPYWSVARKKKRVREKIRNGRYFNLVSDLRAWKVRPHYKSIRIDLHDHNRLNSPWSHLRNFFAARTHHIYTQPKREQLAISLHFIIFIIALEYQRGVNLFEVASTKIVVLISFCRCVVSRGKFSFVSPFSWEFNCYWLLKIEFLISDLSTWIFRDIDLL